MLSSLVKLQHLNLAFCSKLTDSCLQYIAGQTPFTLRKRCSLPLATLPFNSPPPLPPSSSFPRPGLKHLCFLSLDQTKVTDAGMVAYLQSAPSCLSQLSLNQTAVTEATLAVLPQAVPQLRLLNIKQTKVSGAARSRLSHQAVVPFLMARSAARCGTCRRWLGSAACRPSLWTGRR